MKLNNRGFAISGILYSILILFVTLFIGILALLATTKFSFDKIKNDIVGKLEKNQYISSDYSCVTDRNLVCSEEDIKSDEGILVNVRVNDSENYDFYVIEDTGSKLTLIMDRNLGATVAWYADASDNSKGPLTALNYLNSETAGWKNISAIGSYTYDNNLNGTTNTYGYQKLEITNGAGILTSQDGKTQTELTGTSRVRLLTEEEVQILKTANSNKTPKWLYANLRTTSDDTSLPPGYWFLTVDSSTATNALAMHYSGSIYELNVINKVFYGIRPVITVSK